MATYRVGTCGRSPMGAPGLRRSACSSCRTPRAGARPRRPASSSHPVRTRNLRRVRRQAFAADDLALRARFVDCWPSRERPTARACVGRGRVRGHGAHGRAGADPPRRRARGRCRSARPLMPRVALMPRAGLHAAASDSSRPRAHVELLASPPGACGGPSCGPIQYGVRAVA